MLRKLREGTVWIIKVRTEKSLFLEYQTEDLGGLLVEREVANGQHRNNHKL